MGASVSSKNPQHEFAADDSADDLAGGVIERRLGGAGQVHDCVPGLECQTSHPPPHGRRRTTWKRSKPHSSSSSSSSRATWREAWEPNRFPFRPWSHAARLRQSCLRSLCIARLAQEGGNGRRPVPGVGWVLVAQGQTVAGWLAPYLISECRYMATPRRDGSRRVLLENPPQKAGIAIHPASLLRFKAESLPHGSIRGRHRRYFLVSTWASE